MSAAVQPAGAAGAAGSSCCPPSGVSLFDVLCLKRALYDRRVTAAADRLGILGAAEAPAPVSSQIASSGFVLPCPLRRTARSGAGRGPARHGQGCGDSVGARWVRRITHPPRPARSGPPARPYHRRGTFAAHRADLAVDLDGPALDQLLGLAARLTQPCELQKGVKLYKVGVNGYLYLRPSIVTSAVGVGHVRPSSPSAAAL